MRGEIIGQKGDVLTVKLFDELDIKEVKKQAVDGRYYVYVDVFEKDSITDLQRRQLFALFKDRENHTGDLIDAVEALYKYEFMEFKKLDEFPSLARNAMKKTIASEFIDYVLLDYIDKGIPFRGQEFYLTTDTSKMLFALTMKRWCWCCGKPNSDIAHVEVVGAGRNRKKIDHTEHHFMCLCRTHHQEQHTMEMDSFLNKYHIKPIKLSEKNLIELGLTNKKENENE